MPFLKAPAPTQGSSILNIGFTSGDKSVALMGMVSIFGSYLRRALLGGAVLMSACALWAAPSAETINLLYDYYKAVGGRQAIAQIHSLKVSGLVDASVKAADGTQRTVSQSFEFWLAEPNFVRFNIRANDMEISRGWDGHFGWIAMPAQPGVGRSAKIAPKETQEGLLYLACMFDNLYAMEQKGYAFSIGPSETIDGDVLRVLNFSAPDGVLHGQYLLDPKTFLPKYLRLYPSSEGKKSEGLATFGDWREVDGVRFPFSVNYVEDGKPQFSLAVNAVRINIPAPNFYFVMPEKEIEWLQKERQRKKSAAASKELRTL